MSGNPQILWTGWIAETLGAKERMYKAAIALGEVIKYRSAGTVEFIVDGESPNCDFFFLELNARIQ